MYEDVIEGHWVRKAQEDGGRSTSAVGESNGNGLNLVVVTDNDGERRSGIHVGAERKGGVVLVMTCDGCPTLVIANSQVLPVTTVTLAVVDIDDPKRIEESKRDRVA
jgi:hypothetical protein